MISEKYNPESKNLVYSYRTTNIGDFVQSVASAQYWNEFSFVDRDRIPAEMKGRIIANGWHSWNEKWEMPRGIDALFTSFHTCFEVPFRYNQLKGKIVGCRDIGTLEDMQRNGIDSYLSKCLTYTLGKTYQNNSDDRVIVNDVWHWDDICFEKSPGEIRTSTNTFRNCGSALENFLMAENFLKDLSKAQLVFTSRLHTALPCVAMGTPVIFINRSNVVELPQNKKRLEGLIDDLVTMNENEFHLVEQKIEEAKNFDYSNRDEIVNRFDNFISEWQK